MGIKPEEVMTKVFFPRSRRCVEREFLAGTQRVNVCFQMLDVASFQPLGRCELIVAARL